MCNSSRSSLFFMLAAKLLAIGLCRVSSTKLKVKLEHSNSIYAGESETFECFWEQHNQSNSPVVRVTRWELDGKVLDETNNNITISPPDTRHRLKIKSAAETDAGTYTCFAQIHGVLHNASQPLTFFDSHVMITYPTSVTRATVGSSVTLICKSRNHLHITWHKDGRIVVPDRKRVTETQNTKSGSRLRINNVTRSDNGTYKCHFIPTRGTRVVYRNVELIVRDAVTVPVATDFPQTPTHSTTVAVGHRSITSTTSTQVSQTATKPRNIFQATNSTASQFGVPRTTNSEVVETTSSPHITEGTKLAKLKSLLITTSQSTELTRQSTSHPTCDYDDGESEQGQIPQWALMVLLVCASICCLSAVGCLVCLAKKSRQQPSSVSLKDHNTGKSNTDILSKTTKNVTASGTQNGLDSLRYQANDHGVPESRVQSECSHEPAYEELQLHDSTECVDKQVDQRDHLALSPGEIQCANDSRHVSVKRSANVGTTGYVEMQQSQSTPMLTSREQDGKNSVETVQYVNVSSDDNQVCNHSTTACASQQISYCEQQQIV